MAIVERMAATVIMAMAVTAMGNQETILRNKIKEPGGGASGFKFKKYLNKAFEYG